MSANGCSPQLRPRQRHVEDPLRRHPPDPQAVLHRGGNVLRVHRHNQDIDSMSVSQHLPESRRAHRNIHHAGHIARLGDCELLRPTLLVLAHQLLLGYVGRRAHRQVHEP